ncbi:protein FAM3C-like isoform X1 [Salarias fasciatus]|uniref:protein FAM3C-like isoform X1 n=1 Tax=Salarias fasciatus TaxID=181472 RepID=UPI001176D66E|nr:protein FAM3C-like isoform X1 [Salarias fasciatus]
MKCRVIWKLAPALAVLITLGISINYYNAQEKVKSLLGFYNEDQKFRTAPTSPSPRCGLSAVCPSDRFAVHIRSGAANIVGPKICFDGKTIMSHVLNNVGPGLNVVVADGEDGVVVKHGYLDMQDGNPEDILDYLKSIKPGLIVLVASFGDVTKKMTPEMREIFVGMGSTLIRSVKQRDSWVFAGRAGTEIKSLFEKRAVNDEKTNIYEGWPEIVEVGGCFPRSPAATG